MTALPTTRHRFFSPARVAAIVSNTLLELVRLKVFYFMLIFALLIIGSSAFTAKLTFQEQFQVLKDVSLGAMSIFTWLLAVLATAMLLPKDIEDRTLYTILAKPVPRLEYLLGKLLGVLALLAIAIALMSVVFCIVLYAREQSAIAQATREYSSGPLLDQAIADVKSATFTTSLLPGIIVIYLKAALCAALTLLLSTFASSWIFTIIVSVVVYLIGHVQPIAREYWLSQTSVGAGTKIFLAFISLIFPDMTAFNLVDDIVVGNAIALDLFLKTAALGVTYIAVYFLAGYFLFSAREL